MGIIRNLLGVTVAAAAIAVGGVYVLRQNPPQQTQPTTPIVMDAAVTAKAGWPSYIAQYSLIRDSAAYIAPSLLSPQLYRLPVGTGLNAAYRSPDGAWILATAEDGSGAFLPMADLGPYDPHLEPQLNLPQSVTGQAAVLDAATLTVGGQAIALAGIFREQGNAVSAMKDLLAGEGTGLTCTRLRDAFQCALPSGADLGLKAVSLGLVDVTPDAPDTYKAQAAAAKAARLGRWKT